MEDVEFAVAAGEVVGLVGPSGAGKSTVLGLLNGGIVASSGEVRVFGGDPIDARIEMRRRVGMVFQHLHLVPALRVIHNVGAGRLGSWSVLGALVSLLRPADPTGVIAALRTVGLEDRAWDRTDRLSGGEQQRVAVARVLYQQPDLVLADEPISSLDPEQSRRVMETLVGYVAKGDRAAVLSLHDVAWARRHCSRLVGLRSGRVVFDRAVADVTGADLDALYALEP